LRRSGNPPFIGAKYQSVTQRAQVRRIAGLSYPEATLADLYDATVMKAELRRAHKALDAAVDRLYRAGAFSSDRERVEHLFGLYESMAAPLIAATAPRPSRRRRTA
jgi:hypothetical protein